MGRVLAKPINRRRWVSQGLYPSYNSNFIISRDGSVDVKTKENPTTKYPLGALVAEGKTKRIHEAQGGSDLVTVISKDDITAGDGAKHDVIADKGRLANATTCNVFRLLKACGLPVAFVQQDSATSFIGPKCQMLPYE